MKGCFAVANLLEADTHNEVASCYFRDHTVEAIVVEDPSAGGLQNAMLVERKYFVALEGVVVNEAASAGVNVAAAVAPLRRHDDFALPFV